jgi:hypothetical protein
MLPKTNFPNTAVTQGAAGCMLRPPRARAGLARLLVLQPVPERLQPANAIFYPMTIHSIIEKKD